MLIFVDEKKHPIILRHHEIKIESYYKKKKKKKEKKCGGVHAFLTSFFME